MKTLLKYHLPRYELKSDDFETILRASADMDQGQKAICSRYEQVDMLISLIKKGYAVSICGKNEEIFNKAVNDFLVLTGPPDRVKGAYKTIDDALTPFSKQTEPCAFSFIYGRAVVGKK